MEVFLYNLTQLIKILFPLILLFLFIPLFVNRSKEQTIPLKIIKGITLAVFIAVITGYLLSLTKLYNIFFLTLIYFPLLLISFIWVEEINIKELLFAKGKIQKPESQNLTPIPYLKILFIVIFSSLFIYFFFLRSKEVLFHIMLYYSDPFVHLVLYKLFITGEAILRAFCPMGYYAFIGLISTYSFSDPMEIVRLLGPIQSTIILFTLFFMVYEITNNRNAAILVTSILGIDVTGIFPNVFYRQIIALPQEFATIFLLPIAYFAVQYMLKKQAKDLKYFVIAVCNTLFIHVNAAALALFLFLAVFLSGLLLRLWGKKTLIRIGIFGAFTAVVGAFPLIIWSLIQKSVLSYTTTQESLKRLITTYQHITFDMTFTDIKNFLWDAINPIKDAVKWHNMLSADIIIYSTIISLVYICIRLLRKKPFLIQHVYLMVFSLTQFFYIIFYYGTPYNLPHFVYYERIALALSLSTLTIIGILINELFSLDWLLALRSWRLVNTIITFIVLVLFIFIFPRDNTHLVKLQYEGALKTYIKIRENFQPKSWIIISPVEEYALVLWYGWHYELTDFLTEFSMADARNEDFSFTSKIYPRHIFVYVEKNPLVIWTDMPKDGIYASQVDDPYKLYSSRKKLEKYVQVWMKEYIKSHRGLPNNAKVFYEDKDLTVYYIVNLPKSQY